MNNNKNKTGLIVAVVLLLTVVIGIGYVALSATLNINGTSKIEKVTWDVHLENIQVTAGSVTATKDATLSGITTVVYEIVLPTPGSFYEFTVDIKNAGTLPAKLSATPAVLGVSTEQDVYTNYTVKYSDESTPTVNDVLAAGTSKTLKVRVEYDKNITAAQLPTTDQTLALTYSMNYIQG